MLDIYYKATELLREGEDFAIITIVKAEGSAPRGVGTKMIVKKDGKTFGNIGGDVLEQFAIKEALKVIKVGQSKTVSYVLEEEHKGGIGMRCGGNVDLLIESTKPPLKLLIIGSGYIANALAKIGPLVGFSITVVDPFAQKEDFPDAKKVIIKDPESGISEVNITPDTYIVVTTRHKYDELALKKALESNATYIGMIGSKNRVKTAFKTLVNEGVSEKDLQKVYAPIGLDINAETPEEIAISIIAEMVKHKQGGTGESLSSK